jgi:hypothetical protein
VSIATVADYYEDPIRPVLLDAFELPHLKTSVLIDYMMGHLPSGLPAWAVADFRRGIAVRVSRELRREFIVEDRHGERQRERVWVPINGYHKRLTRLSVPEYGHYIDALVKNHRFGGARIAFHKGQYEEAVRRGGEGDLGDLLGFTDDGDV